MVMDSSDSDDLARSEDREFEQLIKQLPISPSPKPEAQKQESNPASDPSLSDEEEGGESEEDELEDPVDHKETKDKTEREHLLKQKYDEFFNTNEDEDNDSHDSSSSGSLNDSLDTKTLQQDIDFSNFNPDEQGESKLGSRNDKISFEVPQAKELPDFELTQAAENEMNSSLGQIDDDERRFFEELAHGFTRAQQ